MAAVPKQVTSCLWNSLAWVTGSLQATNLMTSPLSVPNAPKQAGLYRVTWIGVEDWRCVKKSFRARATKKISDPHVDFSGLCLPIVLSIGKTTNVFERIRQHFGTNENNNRILQRLRQIAPSQWTDADIRLAALRNLKIEWSEVPDWIERSLLESYGKATHVPILDLDAEH